MNALLKVAVCACTYKRPKGLQNLLRELAAQEFNQMRRPEIAIVIADNECSDEAEQICRDFRKSSGNDLIYVREPRRGIPFARNALLDNIPDDVTFFAMIDDDETPDREWLEQLLLIQRETGADIVRGPVVPEFPANTPSWIVAANVDGWPNLQKSGTLPKLKNGQDVEEASTNNVLVTCEALHSSGLKFDNRLGNMGCEDYVFFREMRAAGYRIVYAEKAIVRAPVHPARASTSYVFLRQYQAALSHIPKKTEKRADANQLQTLLRSTKKTFLVSGIRHVASGFFSLLSSLYSRKYRDARFALFILRTGYGIGLLSRLFRVKYEIYNDPAYNSETK